MSMLALVDLR